MSDEPSRQPRVIQTALPANFLELPEVSPDFVKEIATDLDRMVGLPKAPIEFTPDRKVKFLMFLAKFGMRYRAAQYAGVSYQTAKNHKESDKAFGEAWDQAIDIFKESLESEALRRALDGWDEPVYQKGELVGHIHRHSERMMELLLKANIPDKYRENVKIDANVTNTGVLVVEKHLDEAEWEQRYGQKTIDGTAEEAGDVPRIAEG